MSAPGRLPYVGALDGLRALAVTAVVLFHAELPWPGVRSSGGFLGVDVFFVLSGYLITSLLLAHWRGGGIDLATFWCRRARRLLPAVFAVLAAVLAYTTFLSQGEVASLRGDALAALGHATNWYLIIHQESYFESWGRPSVLRHLWSLAIEEQFYLLWPLFFLIGMRWLGRRGLVVALIASAVASTALMAVLYQPGSDPSRVYYGTDTHAAGLLIGSALALVWPPARPERGSVGATVQDVLGLIALAVLVGMSALVSDSSPVLYRGGFLLVALATAAIIVAIVNPTSRLGAALGWAPLRWVGLRSYSIYLWHWPVFMFTRPELDVPFSGLPLFALRLAITLAVAEASYRLVETPVRNGALQRAWNHAREANTPGVRFAAVGVMGCLLALTVTLGVSTWRASLETPEYFSASAGLVPSPLTLSPATSGSDAASPGVTSSVAIQPATALTQPATRPGQNASGWADCRTACLGEPARSLPPSTAASAIAAAGVVTGIGDSVMLAAAPDLRVAIPTFGIHANLGRQASEGVEVARWLKERGTLGEVVIVHLGNNGPFSEADFDTLMTFLADRKLVIVVNVNVPRPWEGPNNEMLASSIRRFRNAALIDWNARSDEHADYLLDDRIHLGPRGAQVYAELVVDRIARSAARSTASD